MYVGYFIYTIAIIFQHEVSTIYIGKNEDQYAKDDSL